MAPQEPPKERTPSLLTLLAVTRNAIKEDMDNDDPVGVDHHLSTVDKIIADLPSAIAHDANIIVRRSTIENHYNTGAYRIDNPDDILAIARADDVNEEPAFVREVLCNFAIYPNGDKQLNPTEMAVLEAYLVGNYNPNDNNTYAQVAKAVGVSNEFARGEIIRLHATIYF